jgi:prevent-host-death family protein
MVGIRHYVVNVHIGHMSKMAATALRNSVAETLNRVAYQGERIELERHGKSVAALVSIEDLELLEALENRIDLAAARRALKESGRRSWEKVKAELSL